MKRRTFLHAGTISLFGAGMSSPAFRGMPPSGLAGRQLFSQLVAAFQARQSDFLAVLPAGLTTAIGQNDAFLGAYGFSRQSARVYFCNQHTACFYLLKMRHASAGLTEWFVPFFVQQPDGSWKRLATFNTFQLEALCHAAAILAGRDLAPAEYLAPAGSAPTRGDTYHTRNGSVSINTLLYQANTQTSIEVRANNTVLLEDIFDSRHLRRLA